MATWRSERLDTIDASIESCGDAIRESIPGTVQHRLTTASVSRHLELAIQHLELAARDWQRANRSAVDTLALGLLEKRLRLERGLIKHCSNDDDAKLCFARALEAILPLYRAVGIEP